MARGTETSKCGAWSMRRDVTIRGRRRATGTAIKTIYKSLFAPEGALPDHGIQEKLQGVDQETQRKDDSTGNAEVMTTAPKTKPKCARTLKPEGKAGDGICHLNAQCGRVSPAAPNKPPTCDHKQHIFMKTSFQIQKLVRGGPHFAFLQISLNVYLNQRQLDSFQERCLD